MLSHEEMEMFERLQWTAKTITNNSVGWIGQKYSREPSASGGIVLFDQQVVVMNQTLKRTSRVIGYDGSKL